MEGNSPGQAFGALIFTCNGRGRNLFGEPHYDSRKIAEFIPVPSSGFLCNGRPASFGCTAGMQPLNVLQQEHCSALVALCCLHRYCADECVDF